jgi:hypothetical protein
LNASVGVFQPRVFLDLVLSTRDTSVPLGKYRRSSPWCSLVSYGDRYWSACEPADVRDPLSDDVEQPALTARTSTCPVS